MIKAMILYLLGAIFEVRLINCRTGKDIPGRCLYKGSYWKARKVFRRRKLKMGYILRLQAVSLIAFDDRVRQLPKKIWSDDDVADFKNKWDIGAANARQSDFMHEHQDEPNVSGPDNDDLGLEDAESKSRWSDDDSHAAAFTENDDHECNSGGHLEYDKALGYLPTCTICGLKQ